MRRIHGYPGFFITFEGGEGGGKTTQIQRLEKGLASHGFSDILLTQEPGGDPVGNAIRALLLNPESNLTDRTEVLLFEANRAQAYETIIVPALSKGTIVISDRSFDSSTVYQGYARGLGRDRIVALNDFATNGLYPDLTILLDLDPSLGLQRQEDHNRMEMAGLEFHKKVREGFRQEAELDLDRFCVIDAHQSIEAIQEAILGRVLDLVRKKD